MSPEKSKETLGLPKMLNNSFAVLNEGGSYLGCMQIYLAHFGAIACVKLISRLHIVNTRKWINDKFKEKIITEYIKEIYVRPKRKMVLNDMLFVIQGNLLLDLDCNGQLLILYTKKDELIAESIAQELIKNYQQKVRNRQTYVSVITKSTIGEMRLISLDNKTPKLSLNLNYNEDLLQFHNNLIPRLRKNISGVVMLFGCPGSGKSTYLRWLISLLPKKRVIFLPTRMAQNLDNLQLMDFLIQECAGSILIVEDSDALIESRENTGNSSVSMLLNLADGILGSSLGIITICTFNTNISNIDKALLRPGRLIGMYEFKKLSVERANNLIEQLGLNKSVTEPKTLAEIYNATSTEVEGRINLNQKIGFKNGE